MAARQSLLSVGNWHRRRDPQSGAFYYVNILTKESVWTKPEEWLAAQADKDECPWMKVRDPNSGKDYYVNQTTRESSWTVPEGYQEPTEEPVLTRPSAIDASHIAAAISTPDWDPDEENESDGNEEEEVTHRASLPVDDDNDELDITARRLAALQSNFVVQTEAIRIDYYEEAEKATHMKDWASEREKAIASQKSLSIVRDFLDSEEKYIQSMQVIVVELLANIVEKQEDKLKTASPVELSTILRNLQELYENVHGPMWKEFDDLIANCQGAPPTFHDIWFVMEPYLVAMDEYAKYIAGHERAMQLLEAFKESRPHFRDVVEKTNRDTTTGFTVEDAFHKPTKRLLSYIMDISDLMKNTCPTDENYPEISKACSKVQTLYYETQANAYKRKARNRVIGIQKQLWFPNKQNQLNLLAPHRFHIQDGVLMKKFNCTKIGSKFKHYWFFLFNDVLLYTTLPDKKGRIEPKYMLKLDDTAACTANGEKEQFFQVQSPVKTIIVKSKDKQERDLWVTMIKKSINQTMEAKRHALNQGEAGKRGW